MVVLVCLGKAQFLQDEEEDLEVVLLLVAHGVDLAVQCGEVFEPQDGRANVLGHVNGGAVPTKEEFLVEAVFGEVHQIEPSSFWKNRPLASPSSTCFLPKR